MSDNPTKHTKVLIIGSGPAGYTAAVYAARAMLNPILVYGSAPGGQLSTTTDVENYPGFADVIQGPWLMDQMKDQAKAVGTEMIEDHISSVNLKSVPFEALGDSGQKYTADSIIISTGAQARWLNLESEQKFRGFGVSACATCDGFFFKDKEVAVVGGGKKAYLSALAIAQNIIVTCDSSSMISEAALTGKPIYIASILPKKNDKRFQRFRNLFRELNITRNLGEEVENWNYQKLDETNRVAKIIKQKINF